MKGQSADRTVAAGMVVTGFGLLAGSLLADRLQLGAPGFGKSQWLLAMAGTAAASLGGVLTHPAGRRFLESRGLAPASVVSGGARYLTIGLQLGLLALVVRAFRIESPAFYQIIVPLTFYGFLIHHLLPSKFRLPFFLLLSLTGIGLVFGLTDGAWLVGIGLVLIGICHLPVSFPLRIGILATAGTALALQRGGILSAPWSAAIWPILGSMFMFRLIVYLYELRHSREPTNLARTLSYFFLLPNVTFPLFPVVDFGTFRRNHYDQDAWLTYQRGIRWMLLGTAHLILYRFVYQYLTISPSDVGTALDLAGYMATNFMLYLRVSGQFHMIVGLLHLFGFRLPETHHFFFLASSFTDFWRRINIYWKDFMMKVFHYPVYFRLKKRGPTVAMVASTLLVFTMTWAFHSYQWFWILGSVLLSWTDTLFWAILAVLLVANSLYELKYGRERTLGTRAWSFGGAAALAVRTLGTLVVICILWALWTSPTLADWRTLWAGVRPTTSDLLLLLTGALTVVLVLTVTIHRGLWDLGLSRTGPDSGFWRGAAMTGSGIVALYLAGQPATASALGPVAQAVMRDLRVPELNRQDAALLQRGYYEQLVGVNRFNNQLWETLAQRPDQPAQEEDRIVQPTGDILFKELRPLIGVLYVREPFRTNQWGMRDRDYALLPPSGTRRIALLGASTAMGTGVGDGETFEWILEDRLNRRNANGGTRYEILNFAVRDYTAFEQLWLLENKVLSFKPDVILLNAHTSEAEQAARRLGQTITRGVAVPYPYLRDLATQAGVDSTTAAPELLRKLKPHRLDIVKWLYGRIAEVAQARGISVIWVHLPLPGDRPEPEEVAAVQQIARVAGFHALDLADAFAGFEVDSVRLGTWDHHPNRAGHRLIADRLYRELVEQPGGSALAPKP